MTEPVANNTWGPNQRALFERVTAYITKELSAEGRQERTNKRMIAALVGDVEELSKIPNEIVSPIESLQHEMYTGFLALFSMVDVVRSTEYYFRRCRFGGLPISRADHLRNCCEMYFDRIVQFRDRMKSSLNAAQRLFPEKNFYVGRIVKAYDKAFLWEIKQRNRVHHKGRYEDKYIDQLAMLQLLEIGSPEIKDYLSSNGIHRAAVNIWVKKVRYGADALSNLLEQISELVLNELPPLPQEPAP